MKGSMTSNLTVKVGTTMVVVVILAVGLATLLNLLRFQETYEKLIVQRLEVAVQEVGRPIVAGAGLGLRVEAQGNLPALLGQSMATHPDVSAIAVHDCAGKTVAGRGWTPAFGEPWRSHTDANRWHAFGRDGLTVGLTLRDSLGTCVAGVALRQPAETFVAVLDDVTGRFLAIGTVAAVLAVFSVLAAAFYFDDRRRSLQRLETDLAAILEGQGLPPPPRVIMATFGNRWERDMVTSYLEARDELAAQARAATQNNDGRAVP